MEDTTITTTPSRQGRTGGHLPIEFGCEFVLVPEHEEQARLEETIFQGTAKCHRDGLLAKHLMSFASSR